MFVSRSEYCRNVKLKYCLMSDAPWAKAFREKLAKQPSEGGFTGKHKLLPSLNDVNRTLRILTTAEAMCPQRVRSITTRS